MNDVNDCCGWCRWLLWMMQMIAVDDVNDCCGWCGWLLWMVWVIDCCGICKWLLWMMRVIAVDAGIVGTTRFCSSRDMFNSCQYVTYPNHNRIYRACIFTCDTDNCNSASVSAMSVIALIVSVIVAVVTVRICWPLTIVLTADHYVDRWPLCYTLSYTTDCTLSPVDS